jgi:hypothetical protein
MACGLRHTHACVSDSRNQGKLGELSDHAAVMLAPEPYHIALWLWIIAYSLCVTVMRRSRSRVGGLVLLPHFIGHLLPELHHRYVM